jgi:hypothetical protein
MSDNFLYEWLRSSKPSRVHINVIIAVMLRGFLSSEVQSEAELQIFKILVFAIPDSKLWWAVESFPHRLAMDTFFMGSLDLVEPIYVEKHFS